ncbi:MAG: response regulator, partial [Clostridiales bacterium]|nr:response regulator [Clostridiales bacterium]
MSGKDAYRVLVVEDELPILDNLVRKIEASSLPFTVVGSARDGESGLAFLRENQVDLLVTDIRMPVMDGLKLLKEARELYPALKVLIISGYDEFSYAQEALRHGASDYLLKPVSADGLHKALEKLYADLRQAGRRGEREIVASGLAGKADFPDVPSSLTHRRYGLHLIAVGNLVHAGAAPTNEQ